MQGFSFSFKLVLASMPLLTTIVDHQLQIIFRYSAEEHGAGVGPFLFTFARVNSTMSSQCKAGGNQNG